MKNNTDIQRPTIGKKYIWYYSSKDRKCWMSIIPIYYSDEYNKAMCRVWTTHTGEQITLFDINRLEMDMKNGYLIPEN